MFIKFQAVVGGSVYIRAEDWRSMVDWRPTPEDIARDKRLEVDGITFDDPGPRCRIGYVPQNTDSMIYVLVLGTADENYERVRNDEMKAAIEYERAQRRQNQGLPSVPVQRGRQ